VISGERSLPAPGTRIARNAAVLGLGDAFVLAVGFLTTLLVTDHLGKEYGLFIGAQRFVALFLVVAQFGLQTLVVREVATRRGGAGMLTADVLLIRIVLGTVFGGVVLAVAAATGYMTGESWLLMAFVAIEFVGLLVDVLLSTCQGLEAMGRSSFISGVRSLVTCVGVVVVIASGGGLASIVTVYLVARVLQLAVALAALPAAAWPLTPSFAPGRWGAILREASWYLSITIGYMALRSLDVVTLKSLSRVSEVARYGAAINFLDALGAFPILIERAVLPTFTRLVTGGQAEGVGARSLRVFSAVLFPAAVGLGVLAPRAVALYPSGEFADAAGVLTVLSAAFFFLGLMALASTLLTGAGRLLAIVSGYAAALVVQMAVNVLLIPRLGAVGAALGITAAAALQAFWLLGRLSRIGVELPIGGMARQACAAAVMGGFVWTVRDFPLPLCILIGLVTYGLVLFALVEREGVERRVAADVWRRLRRRDGT
jgi:O-antigen/teichoic acid export membrane protein